MPDPNINQSADGAANVIQIGYVDGNLVINQQKVTDKPAANAAHTYLQWLRSNALQSGLLRVLEPSNVAAGSKHVTVDQVYIPLNTQRPVQRDEQGNIILEPEHLEPRQYAVRFRIRAVTAGFDLVAAPDGV